jgi:hypothetical protein
MSKKALGRMSLDELDSEINALKSIENPTKGTYTRLANLYSERSRRLQEKLIELKSALGELDAIKAKLDLITGE